MRPVFVGAIAPIFLVMSACVGSLRTTPDSVRTEALDQAIEGATYSLPRLDYEVTVTRYLSSCPGELVEGKPSRLDFALDAKATGSYQRGESYRVDFSKIGGIARTGKFSIENHENGTLKSIGASGEDQTGQVIQDLTKTALSVWSAGSMGEVAAVASSSPFESILPGVSAIVERPAREPDYEVVCTPQAKAKLAEIKAAVDALKKKTDKVEAIKKLTETMSTRASLKLLTHADRVTLSEKFAELDRLEGEIRADSKELATLKKAVGTVAKIGWKTDYSKGYSGQSIDLTVEAEDLDRLAQLFDREPASISPLQQLSNSSPKECYGPGAAQKKCAQAMVAIKTAFATDEPVMMRCAEGSRCFATASRADGVRKAHDRVSDPGIFVRDPVIARLLLCFARDGACTLDSDKAGLEPQFTPQLGQLRFIPFKVRPFEGRSFALQMSKEGRVTKLEYSTDKAMLATFAASAANVASQVEAALEKREERRRKDEDYRHKRSIQDEQDEIDRLNRQIALKEATTKLTPDPLEAVKTETAELQAMKALAEARAARMEAEQKLELLLHPAS